MPHPHKSEGHTERLRKNLFDDLWKLLMHEKAFRGIVAAFLITNLGVSTFSPFKHEQSPLATNDVAQMKADIAENKTEEAACHLEVMDIDRRTQKIEAQMAGLQMYLQIKPLSLLDNSRRLGTIGTNSIER